MKKFKEHSTNDGKNRRIKEYSEIANIYINKLWGFLNIKFIAINDMDLKYEFKKEFKHHLYYNIYQNPPGVLSLKNELSFVKDLTLNYYLVLGDFDLYYNKDEFY